MKRILRYILITAAIAGFIAFATRAAYRAHKNLVTLNVRRMDVLDVIKKIERQTWEGVLVQSNIHGLVTLNVKDMPLEKALALVADQTGARSATLYPLYTTGKSLSALKKVLRGEAASADGWTHLESGNGGSGPRGPQSAGDTNDLISLQITARDLNFTMLALNRFAHVRILPEDGTSGTISLSLKEASAEKAVNALARQTDRKWTELHVLRQERGLGGPGRGGAGPRPDRFQANGEQSEERQAEREVMNDQLLSTLPEEERAQIEQAQAERKERFAEMQNMTPAQRREAMMLAGPGPRGGGNPLDRLKNSTPEQRAQRRPLAMRPGGPAPQFSRQ